MMFPQPGCTQHIVHYQVEKKDFGFITANSQELALGKWSGWTCTVDSLPTYLLLPIINS
jgi:hypothetical protein